MSGKLGKEKSMSLLFVWGLEFLLVIIVWCTGPLSYTEIGQSKDKGQVSFISHSFPEVRDVGNKMFGVNGLGESL